VETLARGRPTGIMDEPMLRAFMPYRTASEVYPANVPGRWIAEAAWPSPRIGARTWYLDQGRLSNTPGSRSEVHYVGNRIVGLQKPEWLPFPPEGLPQEQTPDDRKSLCFDSEPLKAELEILGRPVARIRAASDQPVAKIALRLCELKPDGTSWLVTYGLLNLTHRRGDEKPVPLNPGESYDVALELSFIAHRFAAGSRIRLAVSESLWPLVWPSPKVATLTLTHGASSLELPVRAELASHEPPFPIPTNPPEKSAPVGRTPLRRPAPMPTDGTRSSTTHSRSRTRPRTPAPRSLARWASRNGCASRRATTTAASGKASAAAASSVATGIARCTAPSG